MLKKSFIALAWLRAFLGRLSAASPSSGGHDARRPHSQDGCATLGPSDEAQFVRLHQATVRGDHAHAEAVGAAFGGGDAALVNVVPVPVGWAALI